MKKEKRKAAGIPLLSFCILHSAFCLGFTAVPPRRSRRWIGFFVVLGLLSVLAIAAPLFYNLSLQLHPEQLDEARRRWQENGPADYDLKYLGQTSRGGQEETNQYRMEVRGGRVIAVIDQGEVVYLDPTLAIVAGPAVLGVSSENPRHYGVPALFDEIEAALRERTTGKQRDYIKADFDLRDGHPNHFIHRVPRTKERVEWFVKLTRVPPK